MPNLLPYLIFCSSSTDVCLDTDSIFRTALVRCECPDSSLLCVVSELGAVFYYFSPICHDIEKFQILQGVCLEQLRILRLLNNFLIC